MDWLVYGLSTLASVLVLFFVYHRLTANNRSLEKVKKLAERLQGELGAYVETRAEELKHYGIDLEVQQRAAKIALEKIQAAQATLAEKSEAIGAIAQRFKEYDEVLAKLMDMTARVDENLARIHEEASFAEGVNRRLEAAKKGLTAIEREIPLLRQDFAQDARKTVEEFKEALLGELKSGLKAVETELHSVRTEAMAAFEKAQGARALVDAELENALSTASERASDVEDRAFAALKASSESRLAGLESSLQERLAKTEGEAGERLAAMKESMAAFGRDWEAEAGSALADMRGRLEEADGIFARKATEIAALLGSSRDKAAEAESSLARRISEADANLAKRISEAETGLVAKTAAAQSALDASLARIAEARKELDTSLEAAKTRIEEDFAAFGQELEVRRLGFEEGFVAETAALGKSLEALRAEVDTLKTEAYAGTEAKLRGYEDELLSSLAARRAESFKRMDAWLSDMEKTLSGIASEAKARREAEEAREVQEFRGRFVKLRDELHAQMDRMGRDVEELKESILEQDREARRMLEGLAPSFEASAQAIFEAKLEEARRGNPS